jgi:hypothetical protein
MVRKLLGKILLVEIGVLKYNLATDRQIFVAYYVARRLAETNE